MTSAILPVVLVILWWWARGRNTPETMRHAAWAMAVSTAAAPTGFNPWYWLWPLVVIAAADPSARWPVVVTAAVAFLVMPDSYAIVATPRPPAELAVLVGIGLAIWEGWRNRVKFAANVSAAPKIREEFVEELKDRSRSHG